MNDIYREIWDSEIKKLTKKSNAVDFEKFKKMIQNTTDVDDSIKCEYIQKCEDSIRCIAAIEEKNEIENSEDTDSIEFNGDLIDSEDVTVGENAKHVKMSKKKIAAIIGGVALVAVAGVTIHSCHSCSSKTNVLEETTTTSSDELKDDEAVVEKVIKPTLSFDTENTDVMIDNINNFLREALTKGVKLNEETLDSDLESFVDFYVALNIDEIGPGYLGKLYQDDKKSYLDVFNNFIRWAMIITDEAMMSSVKDNNIIDVSTIVANKNEAATLQNAFNLLAQIHDNGLDGNIEALQSNTLEFRKLLEETLLLEEGSYHSYSSSFKVLLAYSAMNADVLLQNYENIVIVDNDIRKIMYEDAEIQCSMALREYRRDGKELTDNEMLLLIDQSEVNNSGVSLAYQLEKKYDQMVMIINSVDVDYSNETSVAQLLQILKADIDLTLYKANQEYIEYNDITYDINHPTIYIPEDSIIINNGENFIEKEELDKHNIDTNNKTTEQIEKEYQESVKNEIESSLENEKTFKDNQGNILETGSDSANYAADYANGYTLGSKQGAIDGNALIPENYAVSGSKGFVAGYAVGYKESYDLARKQRLDAEKNTSTIIETVPPIEQSSEVIESGTLNQPETTSPVVKEEETTTIILEEEVIEEGLLTPKSEEVTLSYNELYQFYSDYLNSLNNIEEETTYSKTR